MNPKLKFEKLTPIDDVDLNVYDALYEIEDTWIGYNKLYNNYSAMI